MIFLPMIIFMAFFAFLILGFAVIVIRIISKSKNSSWTGSVIDKKHNEVRDSDNPNKMNNFYYLVVRTDAGREMKVGLSAQMWNKLAVGDKISKPKGKLYPEKIT